MKRVIAVICGLGIVVGCASRHGGDASVLRFEGFFQTQPPEGWVSNRPWGGARYFLLRVEGSRGVTIHTNKLGEAAGAFRLVEYYQSDQFERQTPPSGSLVYVSLHATNSTSVLTIECEGKRIRLRQGQPFVYKGP